MATISTSAVRTGQRATAPAATSPSSTKPATCPRESTVFADSSGERRERAFAASSAISWRKTLSANWRRSH